MEALTAIAVILLLCCMIWVLLDHSSRSFATAPQVCRQRPLPAVSNAHRMTVLDKDMLLYHNLQNLSSVKAEVVNDTRSRLLELLDEANVRANDS